MKIEYKLTLTSEQAKAIDKAVELLLRLKLGQYEELPFYLTDISRDDFCERRDIAKLYLKQAFAAMQDYRNDTEWKDDEWHIKRTNGTMLRSNSGTAQTERSQGCHI